jgi:hypothetical protein
VDGQVRVAALKPPITGLPPLPPESPKAVAAPVTASAPTTRKLRPPVLRRIGLPDR